MSWDISKMEQIMKGGCDDCDDCDDGDECGVSPSDFASIFGQKASKAEIEKALANMPKHQIVVQLSLVKPPKDNDVGKLALGLMDIMIKGVVSSLRSGLLVGVGNFKSSIESSGEFDWSHGGQVVTFNIGFDAANEECIVAFEHLIHVLVRSQTADPDYPKMAEVIKLISVERLDEPFKIPEGAPDVRTKVI